MFLFYFGQFTDLILVVLSLLQLISKVPVLTFHLTRALAGGSTMEVKKKTIQVRLTLYIAP